MRKLRDDLSWNVLCLQEVSPDIYDQIIIAERFGGWEIYDGQEAVRHMPDGSTEISHMLIIVRKPLRIVPDSAGFQMFTPRLPLKRHSKIFLREAPKYLREADEMSSEEGFIWADVILPTGRVVRVFCTHFVLSTPGERACQLRELVANFSNQHENVVCGDFNTLEGIRGAALNLLLGSSKEYILSPGRERAELEQALNSLGLQNPLSRQITNKSPAGALQLDHVVVPINWIIIEAHAERLRKGMCYGSDHAFVKVVAIPT